VDEELKRHLDGMEARLIEAIRDTETRLLSEFWKWGRSSDQRVRRIEQSDATTVERLAAIEERVFTLKRKAAGGKE
jgi:hypothetical protein